MNYEKKLYWLSQICGWLLFVLLILFQNFIAGQLNRGLVFFLTANFLTGIVLSHSMRYVILKCGLLEQKKARLLVWILALSVSAGMLASILIGVLFRPVAEDFAAVLDYFAQSFIFLLEIFLPFAMVFLIWNVLYFAAIFLKNYEKEEIKNLRLTASMTEVELNNLRAQLNPHFLFNALNSIRALVDENPIQAKLGISQMSRILRSSLTSDRHKFISIAQELSVVKDYLDLEKIRFEDRLDYVIDVPQAYLELKIPPLILQTLVENAVKHGIQTLPNGGSIRIAAVAVGSDVLELSITNNGRYVPTPQSSVVHTGIGLGNARKRLNLIYGQRASIHICNEKEEVKCRMSIPMDMPNTIHIQSHNENIDYRR